MSTDTSMSPNPGGGMSSVSDEDIVVHEVLELPASHARRVATGSVMIVVGLFCALLLGLGSKKGYDASFTLSQAGAKVHVPTVTLPARLTCIVLGLIIVVLGVIQIARGFRKSAMRWVLAFPSLAVVISFLCWPTTG